jgi:hypothetical protein
MIKWFIWKALFGLLIKFCFKSKITQKTLKSFKLNLETEFKILDK